MLNPYKLLKIDQDASNEEIIKAVKLIMLENSKTRKYTIQEIALAQKQLLEPAKRLAADFMFPSNIKSKRIKKIESNLKIRKIMFDINSINAK